MIAIAEKTNVSEGAISVVSEQSAILMMLDRVASDPTQSVERLEQMFSLYQRVEAETSRKSFISAFVEAQSAIGAIVKDAANSQTHSKYATHAALDKVLRPVYVAKGFAVSFDTAESSKPAHIKVLCNLIHKDGHERQYQVDMPTDGNGPKGNAIMSQTHAAGTAISYGKRYLLIAVWNLALVDKDTDGNVPVDSSPISEAQYKELAALISSTNTDLDQFLKMGKIDCLSDVAANKFETVKALLLSKQKGRAK